MKPILYYYVIYSYPIEKPTTNQANSPIYGVVQLTLRTKSLQQSRRFLDNIFIEWLWRSLKYEEVFTKAYESVAEARRGIGRWISFYNDERKHQALGYKTPKEIFD